MANILIIDDSKMSRRMLRTILEGIGHDIAGEAANGEEGVKLYKELKPDAVTMDITMPEKDGIRCLKEINEFDADANVIMVTAAGQKTKMVEAVQSGANEFVAKPFEAEQLKTVIEKVVK